MKRIGITGPTGAGKTTALRALESLGAEVLDADAVYHGLLAESVPLREALVGAFGPDILDAAGGVDRRKLSAAVYPDGLDRLNGLTHPFITAALDRQMAEAKAAGRPAVAIDAIALIESGFAAQCDTVVSVLAPLEVRIPRIMARDHIDEPYARRRALAQPSDGFYRAHSDYVLENGPGETPEAFAAKALTLFRGILGEE